MTRASKKSAVSRVAKEISEEVLGSLGIEDEEHIEAQADYEEFFKEVGVSATCIDVWEILDGGERGYVRRVEWAEVKDNTLEAIRKRFGPRKYLLRFRGPRGTFLGSKTVRITDDKAASNPNGTPPVIASALDSDNKFMRDILIAMIANQKAPPALDLNGVAALMAAMRPAPVPLPPPADPTAMLTAVTSAVAALRGAVKDENPLSLAKTIIELAASVSGDHKEDSWMSVVKDVGKEVVKQLPIASMIPGAGAPPVAAPAPAPVPFAPRPMVEEVVSPVVPPAAPVSVQVSPTAPAPEFVTSPATVADFIRLGLVYLKQKARKPDLDGENLNLIIDWIIENPEEPQWRAILGVIKDGATFENLLQFDHEIATIPELNAWFYRLYNGLREEINNAVDTRRAGRHPDNAQGDAPGSTQGSNGTGS